MGSTRERNIEDTALKNNLEAAEEFARQARLRDLSGLIVIDFIDMEENKNRISVEKKLKESMKKDRARIQIGEISNFGLLELSRQRLRPSIVENSSELCPHCAGSGRIQSIEVSAVQILRAIEEEGAPDGIEGVKVFAHSDVILHILNKKRSQLNEIENGYKILIDFNNDNTIIPPQKKLEIIRKSTPKEQRETETKEQNNNFDNDEKQNKRRRNRKPTRRRRKVDTESDLNINSETVSSNQQEVIKKENEEDKNIKTSIEIADAENDTPTKLKKDKKTTKRVKKTKKADVI